MQKRKRLIFQCAWLLYDICQKRRDVNYALESDILSKMKEADEMLHHKISESVRGTSRRKLVSFQDLYRDEYDKKACKNLAIFRKIIPSKTKLLGEP